MHPYDEHPRNPDNRPSLREEMATHRRAILKEVLSWVLWLAGAFFLAQVLNQKIIVNAEVVSGSMEQTIMTGDRVFGLRTAYMFHEPQRGEIVVFQNPIDKDAEPYIKRIIGMPGETIAVRNDEVYINGEPLDESDYMTYEQRAFLDYDRMGHGPSIWEVKIPEGHYFMMGDCRNRSKDSRDWGFMPREDIIGRVYWDVDFRNMRRFTHPNYNQ